MSVRRINAITNEQLDLRLFFKFQHINNGALFDPYEISKIEILDSNGITILETITGSANITRYGFGDCGVVTQSSWNNTARTIFDRWTFKVNIGEADQIILRSTLIIKPADLLLPIVTVARDSALVNERLDLRTYFKFQFNNVLFDPFSISKVEIIDSDEITILETITGAGIINYAVGIYGVVTQSSWNTLVKTVYDRWTFKIKVGGDTKVSINSTNIRSPHILTYEEKETRKGFYFNNPDLLANKGWGAILTPDELRYVYAFGNDLVSVNSQSITDETLQGYIDYAVQNVERDLKVTLMKKIIKCRSAMVNTTPAITTFDNSEACVIGGVDLRRAIDLTEEYNLKISIDSVAYKTIDCKGVIPSETTLAEIISKINTALGGIYASNYEGRLKIKSLTKGETSYVEITNAVNNDVGDKLLGINPDQTQYTKVYRGWREGVDFEWDDPYDFDRKLYQNYIFIKTRRRPVISLEKADLRDLAGNFAVDIKEWAKVNHEKGSIEFFPNTGSLAAMPIYLGQTFAFNKFFSSVEGYPDAFYIDYTAGFNNAEQLRNKWGELFVIIGKLASINLFAHFGEGKVSGIASSSIGLAGISESYATTMSAENSLLGAEIRQYREELKAWYKMNENKYSGILLGSL